MNDSRLMTIGAFARACGLTASALRFYADSGLLAPAVVDSASGYRYYAPDQVARATLIRRMRESELSLPRIVEILDADGPVTAGRLIDEHVDALTARFGAARAEAARVKQALAGRATYGAGAARGGTRSMGGAVFAAAVDQVLTATAWEPAFPVLHGVHLEAGDGQLVLTATDRYRLATRTLPTRDDDAVPDDGTPDRGTPDDGRVPWAVTVRGDDLRSVTPWLRRRPSVRLRPVAGALELASDDDVRRCRTVAAEFPDYRAMLAALPEPTTRVLVARHTLLAAVERAPSSDVRLRIGDQVTVAGLPVPATVTGPPVTVDFDLATLHPTIGSAVGPDVMLELTEPEQPVLVRSADTGDLTAVAMPIRVPEPPSAGAGVD